MEFERPTASNTGKATSTSVSWSDAIEFNIVNDLGNINKSKVNNEYSLHVFPGSSESLSQSQDQDEIFLEKEEAFVNTASSTTTSVRTIFRKNSSTRYSYLELDNNFLSMSSTNNTDTSDMSESDKNVQVCNCEGCSAGLDCVHREEGAAAPAAAKDAPKITLENMLEELGLAVSKIDLLNDKVKQLESVIDAKDSKIIEQKAVIDKFNASSSEASGSERGQQKSNGGKVINKSKIFRVDEEKERHFRLLQAKLRESKVGDGASKKTNSEEFSDEDLDLKSMKKKMSRKQRNACNSGVARRLRDVGAIFPDDDFETSTSSGTDSDMCNKKCSHRRQVKSGVKVKKRPVMKTELWPHTIANEEDGEDVTSDNISLAKFYSCYTQIMTSCRRDEAQGRSALLQAVSSVLEYLQWSEARTFHNLVMVKIEQGRANWFSDFSSLAESFIDKKVRMSWKNKTYYASGSSSYKGSYYGKGENKGYGKGFRGSGAKFNAGRGKPLYGAVCWQWNFETYSYGEDCMRWHICKQCAEAGKLGEPHKASTHESAGSSRYRTAEC